MAVSQSGFVGELSNAILGCVFCLVAGAYYKSHKTKKGAIIGGILGAVAMALFSVPSNYFIIYPMYYNIMGLPQPVILGMYQVLLPVKNIFEALLVFNLPFTLVKGLIDVFFCTLVYKRISILLKGEH